MFTLPPLPYAYNALEPHIDAQTMEIHHTKHHQAYTDKLNAALQGTPDADKSIEEILKTVSKLPMAVRNNGGGYYNHDMFWKLLSPQGGEPSGKLLEHITAEFGSLDAFKQQFADAAANQFGSGWAWLVVVNGELKVGSTPNQDNPLMDASTLQGSPILGLDVWEHAYYLKYQNKRPDYVTAFWNVVNWAEVERLYVAATT